MKVATDHKHEGGLCMLSLTSQWLGYFSAIVFVAVSSRYFRVSFSEVTQNRVFLSL